MEESKFKLSDDEILELIDDDLTQAIDYQSELSSDREEWYKRFRGAPYGNERDGWSKIIAPVVYTDHQARLAYLMEIFTDDFFILKSDNQDKASKVQKRIRHQMFIQQDGERRLYDFLFNAGLYRYAVMKVYRKDDFDLETKEFPKLNAKQMMTLALDKQNTITKYDEVKVPIQSVDPTTGFPVEQEDTVYEKVKVVRKKTRYAGPCMEALAPWAFGYSADCKMTDWGGIEGRLVYHTFRITLDEVRKREKAGLYQKGTFDECCAIGREPEVKPVDQEAVEYAVDGTPEIITDGAQKEDDLSRELDAYEIYCRLDIDGDGLLEPCIITTIGGSVVAQKMDNPYGRPPFRIGCIIPEPHKVAGISPASILEHDAKVQTNLVRFAQDMAAQSTYQNLVTADPRMQKMLKDRKPFDVILGDPSKVGAVPGNFDITALLKAIELTKGETEEGTGRSRYNQGLQGDSLNKTATGVSLISKAGDRRSRLEAKQIGNSAMSGIIRDFIFINQKWPTDEPTKIPGTQITVTKEDFDAKFDIEIDIGVSPAEKLQMAQQVDLFLQFGTQVGMKLGMTDPVKLKNAVDKKYALLGLNMENAMYSIEEMQQKIEEAKKTPPKVDWKEFVQIDKLYPLLTRNEQMQILQKVEIQPDMQGQVAGLPQARDLLTAQTKMAGNQNDSQKAVQELAIAREKHAMDMQGKKVDQKAKLIDAVTKAYQAKKGNDDRAGNYQ
jgi:hypothetical protein